MGTLIVSLFLAVSWISYGVMFLFLVLAIAISKIPLKSIVNGMKPLVFILTVMYLIHVR